MRRLWIFRLYDQIILNENSINAASKQNKLTNQISLKRSLATSAASPLALANHAAAQTSSSLYPGTSFQIDTVSMILIGWFLNQSEAMHQIENLTE